MRALASTSSAPAASMFDSGCGNDRGRTRTSSAKPMFFMARATEPMLPGWLVSIGVQHRGRMEHAVVYDPMRQEFFTASRGDGAQLEGKRIRVSPQRTLEGSLIGTGFPFRLDPAYVDGYLAMLKIVMATAAGV